MKVSRTLVSDHPSVLVVVISVIVSGLFGDWYNWGKLKEAQLSSQTMFICQARDSVFRERKCSRNYGK